MPLRIGPMWPCELRHDGVLRSSLPEVSTWTTKIVHLGDVSERAILLRYPMERSAASNRVSVDVGTG
jgi:hypothetical protein